MPEGWTANGLAGRRDFRIVSLPYPISVTFSPRHHHREELFDEITSPRSILALFSGSLTRGRASNTGRNGFDNRLRSHMTDVLEAAGAICVHDGCGICVKGLEAHCVSMLRNYKEKDRLWALAINSIFCLEPPGDTLTRSHFFVAVASGCIPIIFDGGDGSPLYSNHSITFWPWRLTNTQGHERKSMYARKIGLDYTSFTVSFNTSDFFVRGQRLLQDVLVLPEKDPGRLRTLQQGVDSAAPAMLYTPAINLPSPRPDDAFARFFALVTAPGTLRGQHDSLPE